MTTGCIHNAKYERDDGDGDGDDENKGRAAERERIEHYITFAGSERERGTRRERRGRRITTRKERHHRLIKENEVRVFHHRHTKK